MISLKLTVALALCSTVLSSSTLYVSSDPDPDSQPTVLVAPAAATPSLPAFTFTPTPTETVAVLPPDAAEIPVVIPTATSEPTPEPTLVETVLPTDPPAPPVQSTPQKAEVVGVVAGSLTYYTCPPYCGDPAGPLPLAEGQAACGAYYPMGTVILVEGDPLGPTLCNDRGNLGYHQIDRFFWVDAAGKAWIHSVGTYGIITVVSYPETN